MTPTLNSLGFKLSYYRTIGGSQGVRNLALAVAELVDGKKFPVTSWRKLDRQQVKMDFDEIIGRNVRLQMLVRKIVLP